MQKGLAESADVRKLAISLKATEYGGELTGKLLAVSKELENLYEGYIDLKARKVVDEKLYQKQLDVLNVKFKFTEKAKAVRTKKTGFSCVGLMFWGSSIFQGKNRQEHEIYHVHHAGTQHPSSHHYNIGCLFSK